jgi:hypothetical protein
VVGIGIRLQKIGWNTEPFRSTAVSLALLGRQTDMTGVAVFGVQAGDSGNYFYLRRNVPLVQQRRDAQLMLDDSRIRDGRINYLIARPEDILSFNCLNPIPVYQVGQFRIYKIGITKLQSR